MDYKNESFIGTGDLYLDLYNSMGVKTGEFLIGNAPVFSIGAPSIEKKELKGMMRANYAQTINAVIVKMDQEMKFTATDVNIKTLPMAMFGDGSALTQDSGTGTETAIAILDRWVKLTHRKLDPATPPVVTVASVVQTEGEDYEIDYQVGRIMALSTGGIADAASMSIESHWLSMTGFKVAGNKVKKVESYVRFVGRDIASERDCEVIVYKCQLEPAGDINWLTEDYVNLEFKGKILSTTEGTWDVVFY